MNVSSRRVKALSITDRQAAFLGRLRADKPRAFWRAYEQVDRRDPIPWDGSDPLVHCLSRRQASALIDRLVRAA